jgi:hypothetical protein
MAENGIYDILLISEKFLSIHDLIFFPEEYKFVFSTLLFDKF